MAITVRIRTFSVPRCCMGKHHPISADSCLCLGLRLGHQSGTVSLKKGWCDCRKGETVWAGHPAGVNQFCTLGRPPRVLRMHQRNVAEGLGEPQGCAALHCAIPGALWAKSIHSTNRFCSALLFCLWTWSCVQGRLWFATTCCCLQ